MGWIEDERSRIAAEAETQRMAEEKRRVDNLEYQKKQDLYNTEQQRLKEQRPKDYSEYWQKARGYFEESGLRRILNQLVEIKAGSISEQKDNKRKQGKFDMAFDVVFNKSDGRYILMRTDVDGDISFNAGINGGGTWNNGERVSRKKWKSNRVVLENALRTAYEHPLIYDMGRGDSSSGSQTDFSHCLSGNSLISVPKGFVPIKNLKRGDSVWTTDRLGRRVQAVIIQKTRRVVSKDHKMAHIVLKDGRELIVSPGHPTIDNRELGSLKVGQFLDQSEIISLRIISYKKKCTYDILPFGDAGGYWANNILIGSTLSNKFKEIQWHRGLFV